VVLIKMFVYILNRNQRSINISSTCFEIKVG